MVLGEGVEGRLVGELDGARAGLLLEPLDNAVVVPAAAVLLRLCVCKEGGDEGGELLDSTAQADTGQRKRQDTLPDTKNFRVGKPWTAYFSASAFSWVASTCSRRVSATRVLVWKGQRRHTVHLHELHVWIGLEGGGRLFVFGLEVLAVATPSASSEGESSSVW